MHHLERFALFSIIGKLLRKRTGWSTEMFPMVEMSPMVEGVSVDIFSQIALKMAHCQLRPF